MKTTLEKWAAAQYGDSAPSIKTLRAWVRDARIYPLPQKHGRQYYIEESARYVGDFHDPEFMGRMRDATQAQ